MLTRRIAQSADRGPLVVHRSRRLVRHGVSQRVPNARTRRLREDPLAVHHTP